MRLSLIGASGYVGSEFVTIGKKRGLDIVSVGRTSCDIYNTRALTDHLKTLAPDVLINCAGYTGKPNVDACELDKAACLAGNAVLPGVIAEACDALSLPWGHISSGCIYTGKRSDGNGFTEDDTPNFTFRQDNCSFYSGTKALGEEVLTDVDCYIWRLRIPFSNIDSPRNYLSKVMNYHTLLEAENSLSNLDDFVTACLDCFEKSVPYGIYNLTNPGSVTTSEVVEMILSNDLVNREFRFFDSEDQFMQLAAKTPRSNCVMDSTKAITAGLTLPPIRDSLNQAIQTWKWSTSP